MAEPVLEFPVDEAEFQGAWHQCAGRTSALWEVVLVLRDKAAREYIANHDELASEIRSMAEWLGMRHKQAAAELDAYIAEGERRRGRNIG